MAVLGTVSVHSMRTVTECASRSAQVYGHVQHRKDRTQESEPATSKLVDDLDVAASPCHVGDSRYSTIQCTL